MRGNTHRLEFLCNIDGAVSTHILEFAHTDKSAAVEQIRKAAEELGSCTFVDIHGAILTISYARAKMVRITVIELIDF